MTWLLLGTLLPSLLVSLLAAASIRRLAPQLGLVDKPGHRKVHSTPTPLGGGLAIWLGIVLPFAVGQLVLWSLEPSGDGYLLAGAGPCPSFAAAHVGGLLQQSPKLWLLLAAGTVLMLLGLADDRFGLDWRWRILVQIGVASCWSLIGMAGD